MTLVRLARIQNPHTRLSPEGPIRPGGQPSVKLLTRKLCLLLPISVDERLKQQGNAARIQYFCNSATPRFCATIQKMLDTHRPGT